MKIFERKSRLAPFFWLHGESEEILKEEIEAIYNSGIRAVCLESRTHEDFCKEHWFSDVRFIMSECKKRGMKVWILDDKHFPSGYAAGALENENHDMRAWGISETHVDIPGGMEDIALLSNIHLGAGDELLAVIACKHIEGSELLTGEAIDLTENVSDEMVHFSLPDGMWRIFFIKKTRSGINGWSIKYVDMLRPESVDIFIKTVYEKHYEELKDEFGKTFLGFFSDEPAFHNGSKSKVETGVLFDHHPYGNSVLCYLKEKYGDNALKLLPGLWANFDDERENEIRYAYMDFISKEYKENFCNRIADWCHAHGIKYIGHVIEDNRIDATTGNGCGHYFRALDKQDMSGVDVVLTQLVPGLSGTNNAGPVSYKHMNYNFFKYMLAKLGSSMAHLDERKNGEAMCEIFGAFGWVEGTKTMKWLCDHMLVRGINYYVPHAFSAKENDADCPPVFYYRGKNPQYKYFGKIADYLERGSNMISGGQHIADVALLYDAEYKWINKCHVPLEDIAKELYENQIDFDIVPADYLNKVSVTGDEIIINKESFKALIVPWGSWIHPEIKEKLNSLSKMGAKIIFAGEGKTDGFETIKLSDLSDRVKEMGTDVKIDIKNPDIHILHYVKEGKDIYMLTNEGINCDATFNLKMSKKADVAAFYDAMEDKLYKAEIKDGSVKINLPVYGSVFLVTGIEGEDEKPEVKAEKELSLNYKISYAKINDDAFTDYKETDKLFNITGKDEMPRFSGHILYKTIFEAKKGNYLLDLGYVGEVAKVTLNGKDLGSKVIPPYTFDIKEAVRDGENELLIEVTNTNVFLLRDRFSAYMRIEPSGLLGPVKLIEIK